MGLRNHQWNFNGDLSDGNPILDSVVPFTQSFWNTVETGGEVFEHKQAEVPLQNTDIPTEYMFREFTTPSSLQTPIHDTENHDFAPDSASIDKLCFGTVRRTQDTSGSPADW